MAEKPPLSRRERLIMDVLYQLGRATAAEVLNRLPDQKNYSTIRAQLRVLEEKGHVRHEDDGQRYIYVPTLPAAAARKSALKHLVNTFFGGSTEQVVAALVGGEVSRMAPEELERLTAMIADAREAASKKEKEKK